MVTYKLLIGNRGTKECERAVLPTIIYASESEVLNDTDITVRALSIGWWAWGIGIMRTTVNSRIF